MTKLIQNVALAVAALAYVAQATPIEDDMFSRSVGDSCKVPAGNGSCKNTSDCLGATWNNHCPNDPNDVKCCWTHECTVDGGHDGYCRSVSRNGPNGGTFFPGYCPGDSDIQCAAKISCKSGTGLCKSIGDQGCSGGTFHSGFCPGSSNIQCCVEGVPPPSSSGGQSIGEEVLTIAQTKKGVDYVFGGGSYSGATSGGFDCSGLLCYAICKATGRNLFSEGLRVTRAMYCASEKKLGYKKYPFSERKKGDAVFFGPNNCDCDTHPEAVHHVGIMMGSGYDMWNALKTGTKVREDSFQGWTGNNAHCPYVIRITD